MDTTTNLKTRDIFADSHVTVGGFLYSSILNLDRDPYIFEYKSVICHDLKISVGKVKIQIVKSLQ